MAAVVASMDFFIGSFSYFVSRKRPNANYQVSIQLDYREDVRNMNSQIFFSIQMYRAHTNPWEVNLTLP